MKDFTTNAREILYFLSARMPLTAYGRLKGNLVKTHWGRGLNNFGDCLSPYILKHYGLTPVFSQQRNSDIALAGTILQWIPKTYRGTIIGTGGDEEPYDFPNAKILGVRGHKTLSMIANDTGFGVVGDPGLILNQVFPDHVNKRHKLGIVPHFVDKNHRIVNLWKERFGDACAVIDVLRAPPKVIKEIKACEFIVSSSLHGLIVADAFDIPNRRFVVRETMPTDFYDYKFEDYYSSLDSSDQTLEATGKEGLEELVDGMRLHSKKVRVLQERLDASLRMVATSLTRKRAKSP